VNTKKPKLPLSSSQNKRILKYVPIDLKRVRTYLIEKRKNKVKIVDFAKPGKEKATFADFIDSLPFILAGKNFRQITQAIVSAYNKKRPVILAMGAHVIKCGLSPILIDLMKRGVVTAVALNGAGAIHDFEIGLIGETSEDVASGLDTGRFGMAEETGKLMNQAINESKEPELGMGYILGKKLIEMKAPYEKFSILAAGIKLDIPLTVHVAIGTDVIHMHPEANGAIIGEKTFNDFRIFTSVITNLEGGVYLNIGSAVVLPEVFLKALTIARNLGHKVENFTAVNLDMYEHYRPLQNVVIRPTSKGGKGYTLLGQHEILIPLLSQAVIEIMEKEGRGENLHQ